MERTRSLFIPGAQRLLTLTMHGAMITCLIGFLSGSNAMAQFGGGQFPSGEIAPAQAPPIAPPQTDSREYQQIDAMEKRVQAARFGLQVVEVPLKQVVQQFTQQTGIPVRIDQRALEDVGLSVETPITFHLPEVAAETLLYLMLKDLDLVFMFDTRSVVITTPEEEERNLRTKFYAVEDLFNDPKPNYDILVDMIRTCIEPESWNDLGGPGNIAPLRNGIVVSQTNRVHQQLRGLFAAISRVQNTPRQADLPAMMSTSPYAAQAEKLEKQLQQAKTSITLGNAPLERAVGAISKFGRVPLMINRRALEDVGMSIDTPVTMKLSDATIAYMLEVLGEKLELSTFIFGEVVIVTTPEDAESELQTYVYPVKDLVRYDPVTHQELTKRGVSAELDRLINTITNTVEAESWEELGGPGSIAAFPYADCLVVSQVAEVHRKVAELLQQVRTAPPKVSRTEPSAVVPPGMPASAPLRGNAYQTNRAENLIVVSYTPAQDRVADFSREDFTRIAQQLQQRVAPESWAGEETFADATDRGVFVRQTRTMQRRVASYLASQGLNGPEIEKETLEPEPNSAPASQPEDTRPPATNSTGGGAGVF
ncbi:hypothetical protein AB1K70_06665 [Bremerella sp. JC770]|uniref:hypothetical protein n=1 Tax=Bremerella sp. JC770 TaxID=3232137 RepID=UPI003458380F